MEKVSIIVPCYNTEKYIEACLDSIAKQDYTNIEVLLVDDGSKDNTGSICTEFCKKDDRFKYIYQENGGVSSARNKGLANCSGKYITFIDSDDYVYSNFISRMMKEFENNNVDIVMSRIETENFTKNMNSIQASFFRLSEEGILTNTEAVKKMYELPSYGTMATNKLFSRDIIWKDVDFLKFPTDIKCGEDQLWLLEVFNNARKVSIIKDELYFWVDNQNSAFRSMSRIDIFPVDINCQAMCLELVRKLGDGDLIQLIKDRLVDKIYKYRVLTYLKGTKEQNDEMKGLQVKYRNIKHSPVKLKTAFKRKIILSAIDFGIGKSIVEKMHGMS